MIRKDAKVHIAYIPVCDLSFNQYEVRNPEQVKFYYNLLISNPDMETGFIVVEPRKGYKGIYNILDGNHRAISHYLAGRKEVLAIIVEECSQISTIASKVL